MFQPFDQSTTFNGYAWVICDAGELPISEVNCTIERAGARKSYSVQLVRMDGRPSEHCLNQLPSRREELRWDSIVAFKKFDALNLPDFNQKHPDALSLMPDRIEERSECWMVYLNDSGDQTCSFGYATSAPDRTHELPGDMPHNHTQPVFTFVGITGDENPPEESYLYALRHSDDLIGRLAAIEMAKQYCGESLM